MNVKSVKISNELGQNLRRWKIFPNFAQNSESESVTERSKRISSKVDFNIVRDPNILLGLQNYEKMFASSTLSNKYCILYQYLEIILINFDDLSKE